MGMFQFVAEVAARPSAFGYARAASSNICLSDERVEMLLLMHVGSCLKIVGGWLECTK